MQAVVTVAAAVAVAVAVVGVVVAVMTEQRVVVGARREFLGFVAFVSFLAHNHEIYTQHK